MSTLVDQLSLEDLVDAVSNQLLRSQQRRIASGTQAVFEVEELVLEVSFVVTSTEEGGGGFDIKVIKADGKLKYDEESVQKITLKLAAVKDQRQPNNRFGPVRPKLDDDRP